jgi:hypothetical protein
MHLRPIISAGTFGLSELRWSKLKKRGWRGIARRLVIDLGALTLGIPVAWLIGLIAGGIFGSAFGVNLRAYNPATGHADLTDQIRYVLVGFAILILGVWTICVCKALSEEWKKRPRSKWRIVVERTDSRRRK